MSDSRLSILSFLNTFAPTVMNVCPVCGYPSLREPPRATSGGGSYEICPSCGFQFGVDDDDKGISFKEARDRWVASGSKWHSKGLSAPQDWDAAKQLKSIAKKATAKKARKKTTRPKTKNDGSKS